MTLLRETNVPKEWDKRTKEACKQYKEITGESITPMMLFILAALGGDKDD